MTGTSNPRDIILNAIQVRVAALGGTTSYERGMLFLEGGCPAVAEIKNYAATQLVLTYETVGSDHEWRAEFDCRELDNGIPDATIGTVQEIDCNTRLPRGAERPITFLEVLQTILPPKTG